MAIVRWLIVGLIRLLVNRAQIKIIIEWRGQCALALVCFFVPFTNVLAEYELKWGKDDRREIYQGDRGLRNAALSVVALVPWTKLSETQNGYELHNSSDTLRSNNWCAEEPFSQQAIAASCTGFLIDKNRIVTAAHCVKNRRDNLKVKDFAAIFSFTNSKPTRSNLDNHSKWTFLSENVFPLKELIAYEKIDAINIDWAVVELDKNRNEQYPSAPEIQLAYDQPKITDPLIIIGHPLGLPKKFSVGTRIQKHISDESIFRVAIDAYQGDSGAPIFTRKNKELQLVGLMTAGGKDNRISNNCRISATCKAQDGSQRCAGEIVVPINRVQDKIILSQQD